MLENYYPSHMGAEPVSKEKKQRLIAVQAALEIALASVGNSHAANTSRVDDDLQHVSQGLDALADAIQAALNK